MLEPDRLAGQTIGKFHIEALVGEGGMAYVYRGRHIDLDQRVAIKVLFPEYLRRKSVRARFKREARLQFKIQHPNIVRVIDFIEQDRVLGMVLDWVSAGDLNEYLKRNGGSCSLHDVRRFFLPVLSAMAYAHEQGIIHRDLKPHNIMLDGEPGAEVPKVMDFGIAWSLDDDGFQTKTGVVIGTPFYISPEQATNVKQLDHRTDIYSLGITLFQMLTGRVPFVGGNAVEVISAHCFHPVPSVRDWIPDFPEPLDRVIQKALGKRPSERFSNCLEFLEALEQALPEGIPDSVAHPGVYRHPSKIAATQPEGLTPHDPSLAQKTALMPNNPVQSRTPSGGSRGIRTIDADLSSTPAPLRPGTLQPGLFSTPLPSADAFDAVPRAGVLPSASPELQHSSVQNTKQKTLQKGLFAVSVGLFIMILLLLYWQKNDTQKDQMRSASLQTQKNSKGSSLEKKPEQSSVKHSRPPVRPHATQPHAPNALKAKTTVRKAAPRPQVPRPAVRRKRIRVHRRQVRAVVRRRTRVAARSHIRRRPVRVRARVGSAKRCRACVRKAFQYRQGLAIMGHNPHAMDGGGCNYTDFSRAGRVCRNACGRQFYHYCKAYLQQKTGRCQSLVGMLGLLGKLSSVYSDATPQTSRRCLKDWQ